MTAYVHTLGDSSLDNYFWLLNEDRSNIDEACNNSIEVQLAKKGQLKKKSQNGIHYEVVSHAYAGFDILNVAACGDVGSLFGIRTNKQLTENQELYLFNRGINPKSTSYSVRPLDDLREHIKKQPGVPHYIVISLGGEDFRKLLSSPLNALKEIRTIQDQYLHILGQLKELPGKYIRPILLTQYRFNPNNENHGVTKFLNLVGRVAIAIQSSSILGIGFFAASLLSGKVNKVSLQVLGWSCFLLLGVTLVIPFKVTIGVLKGQDISLATFGALIEKFYRPILAKAKEDKIPVLDLSNTFNPYNDLYVVETVPNKEGGKLIVEGINHIIKNHSFENESKIYSKIEPNAEYTASEYNPKQWQVHYPPKP